MHLMIKADGEKDIEATPRSIESLVSEAVCGGWGDYGQGQLEQLVGQVSRLSDVVCNLVKKLPENEILEALNLHYHYKRAGDE